MALSMALVITVAMVLSMALPTMASEATAPTSGSITINSPVVGATYKVYKVFDMTTNAGVDAFSYTINENSPFYGAVVTYASDKTKGLQLSRIKGSNPATYNVAVSTTDYPIVGYGTFDAQAFGKAMQGYLATGSPEVAADTAETTTPGTGIVAKAAGSPITHDYTKDCTITTDNTSDQLVFDGEDVDPADGVNDGIPLGYYLVNPTYPKAAAKTVTMGSGAAEQTFGEADVVRNTDGVATDLTADADEKVTNYVNATVTDAFVDQYIEDHGITTNTDGSPLNADGKAAIKTALKNSMTADAEKKILAAFNGENGQEADINVKEPILVFLDSSQPDAVINEKNELDKWDVPVNPEGEAPEGTPDHGEPEGGKNIIVAEATDTSPAYSADWSESEIGDSVHYQLRVNAMNFIRTGTTDTTIEQVKEYILADYQSAHMHFDKSKGLHVSVWQGNNANSTDITADNGLVNVTKNVGIGTGGIANAAYEGSGTVDNVPYPSINYTNYATDDPSTFFKNTSATDDGTVASLNGDIFGEDGTGIVVPWVFVYDPATDDGAQLNTYKSQYPIYTVTNIPKEENGQPVYKTEEIKKDTNNDPIPFKIQDATDPTKWNTVTGAYVSVNNHVVDQQGRVIDTNPDGSLKTENGNFVLVKETKPVYTFSIYNSDVTIVVDYWMILDDDAIVDDPGNKNFAQYGWNPIDNKDEDGNPTSPTNPDDTDEPSQKEEIDEATVYTFAIAWVKIDEQGKELAGAKFQLPFYVKKDKDGKSYVYGMSNEEYAELTAEEKANYTNEVITTTDAADGEKGVITIKGVKQDTYSITETEAPAGFNKLTAPFTVEAKKSGPAVTTKTKTTVFLDAQGNVTDTVTNITKEYITDQDSYNNTSATSPEETSVPVYQFDPIVNKQGSELPSTGGIGTTIFYVVGAILVLGAGIVLITRRRMDG